MVSYLLVTMLDPRENKSCSKVITLAAQIACVCSWLRTHGKWRFVGLQFIYGLYLDKDVSFHGNQEERQIRPRHFPRDHRRGQEDPGDCKKAGDICAGRRGGRYLLCSKRQSEAHGCVQDR